MSAFEDFYVVEYRYAVKIPMTQSNKNSIPTVVSTANSICERVHGFRPNNWSARIFKYSTNDGVIGVEDEYFYNPHGATVRKIDSNWIDHLELINKEKEDE